MKSGTLLQQLIARDDYVAIENGRLVLVPASGNTVPNAWLQQHQNQLISDIATLTGIDIFTYANYSTGRYGEHRAEGVTLQFDCLTTDTPAYSIFNADITRARNTKAGDAGKPLPKGHFRVREKHNFFKFWKRTSLSIPPRLSAFHDYMGALRRLLFTGEFVKGERLRADSICPVQITCQELKEIALNPPDKKQTIYRQLPDNSRTITPDKQSPETKVQCGLRPIPTTGNSNYGNKEQGSTVTRETIPSISNTCKNPRVQTMDEWLVNYEYGN